MRSAWYLFGVWHSTPTPNMMRYLPKGTYYLRARIKGSIVRESLRTTNYRVACNKLSDRLRTLRSLAGTVGCDDGPQSLWAALQLVKAKVEDDPSLKTSTRRVYREEINALGPGKPSAVPSTPLSKLSTREMEAWWGRTSAEYSAQRANHSLMFVRWAVKIARRVGALAVDPTEDLKPVPVPRTRLQLVTPSELRSILADIRSTGGKKAAEAANWIEFMAYSGLRPAEIQALGWSQIDFEREVITVTGGVEGTKNREHRQVPIISPLAVLLARMPLPHVGPVFRMKKPDVSLRSSCRRLGLPPQKLYNLRHLYATICCASGVDVPTVSKWMGHKDGGMLALKIYVHIHAEHSKAAAKLVTFE
jgi:integrase